MTMVRKLRRFVGSCRASEQGVAKQLGAAVLLLGLLSARPTQAQGVHYLHRGDMSPGAIGSWQLQRGGPLPGYFQPVEIRAPEGVRISLALEGTFDEPQPTPRKVGLLIAPVYRLRVTNIPFYEGRELYPTIEVIDRLYPPPGQETRFPIPIELTFEELEYALDGRFVTRVIYLENPDYALPFAEDPDEQIWIDAGVGNDPLKMADELGRPVAILRMGGRVPLESEMAEFARSPAPWLRYHPRALPPAVEELPEAIDLPRRARSPATLVDHQQRRSEPRRVVQPLGDAHDLLPEVR